MTIYKTIAAQQSAIKVIEGCIKAINEQPELPHKMGTLTVDYITKYLKEYKALIEKDLKRSTDKLEKR